MKNIRRFQRVTLVCFVGINSIVYTEMKGFTANEQLALVGSVLTITTALVLLTSFIRKPTQQSK